MEGFAEGLLAVRWPGEERLRRFPLILPKHDIGEFQLKFCGDASSLSEKPGPDYGDEAEGENILKTLPSFCCDPSDDCRGGQFVTHYEKSFLGLRVKHCRKSGMRTAVILGDEQEFLKLQFDGGNGIKKKRITNFVKEGDFAEYQYRFLCKKTPALNPRVSGSLDVKPCAKADQTSPDPDRCKYCKMSPCAHLKKIFPTRLNQALIGCSGREIFLKISFNGIDKVDRSTHNSLDTH